jgi:hypothetical protein
MDTMINLLTILYRFIKIFGQYVQLFLRIITGHHYSLVNVADSDFKFGTTAHRLFIQNNNIRDYNNPDGHALRKKRYSTKLSGFNSRNP